MSSIRTLAWALAALFVAATLLQLGDQQNLFFKPPDIPQSANLVERVLGLIPYRQSIWPIFFLENLLPALGFIVLSCIGVALAARMAQGDDRRAILATTFVGGGLLAAAGQLVLIGSVKSSIDIPYCDCGFKDQEVVSQVWALMVTRGASDWLVNAGIVLEAVGIALAGAIFGGRLLSRSWTVFSWAIAALMLFAVAIGNANLLPDLANALGLLISGALIPLWAVWLGRGFTSSSTADAEPIGAR